MKLLAGLACGLVVTTALALPAAAIEPETRVKLLSPIDAVGKAVQERLSAPFQTADDAHKRAQGGLAAFYAERAHAPIWVDANGPTAKARQVAAELKRAADYGLDPKDYPVADPASGKDLGERELAELELALSRAALAYARHARGGRIVPSKLSGFLDPTLELPEPQEVLETLARAEDPAAALRGYHPKHAQFEALRRKLLEARGGTTRKPVRVPKGPLLRPGEKHAQVAVIRKRLGLPAQQDTGKATLYDAKLEKAVKTFQKRRGLNPDGLVGSSTRRAMNAANARPKNPVKKILANMERWRWIPQDVGKLHVRVNVPEFRLRVFDDGKVVHSERVVAGKIKNQTPIFSDQIEKVVFNPYWNIPNSIKVKEVLPYLRRNSGDLYGGDTTVQARFIKRNNLTIKYRGRAVDPASIDWERVDVRRYHIYQPPGGPNVLGKMKFVFPNKHSIYMHDTRNTRLFNRPVRAYSHGCMRVRNPRRLAEVLLSRDSGWTAARIDNAIASGKNWPVTLANKIPVHITYFTAWVDDGGKLRYAGDIYGHDGRLATALKF